MPISTRCRSPVLSPSTLPNVRLVNELAARMQRIRGQLVSNKQGGRKARRELRLIPGPEATDLGDMFGG